MFLTLTTGHVSKDSGQLLIIVIGLSEEAHREIHCSLIFFLICENTLNKTKSKCKEFTHCTIESLLLQNEGSASLTFNNRGTV